MTERKTTASEVYQTRRRDVEKLLVMLAEEVGHHAEFAAKEPRDWGHAADLAHIRDLLKAAMVTLSQQAPEDIERRLKSTREEGR